RHTRSKRDWSSDVCSSDLSYALIIEQVIRICFVALFIKWLMPFGVEYAAAGAMFSIILGELISLLYMIFLFKRNKTFRDRRQFRSEERRVGKEDIYHSADM